EETVGRLESRLAKWSDPSEVADEVIGLEEEISMALGRFHKRLDAAAELVAVAASDAVVQEILPLREELSALLEDLQSLPEILAEHRDQIIHDARGRRTRREKE